MASSRLLFGFVLLVALLVGSIASTELDQYTLAKLVGGHNNLFVQVVEHSWDRVKVILHRFWLISIFAQLINKDWEQASKDYLETPEVIVATVVSSEEVNKGFESKYGVSSHPTFLFFPKGQTTPESYVPY